MLSRLIPRDEQFFDLFNQLAGHLRSSAQLLDQLFAEPHRTTELVKQIKDVEHMADQLTLSISTRIDKSFITPIDREDIHLLASRLDDVIDRLDGTARRVVMLHINEVREPAKLMAHVLLRAAELIGKSVQAIKRPSEVATQTAAEPRGRDLVRRRHRRDRLPVRLHQRLPRFRELHRDDRGNARAEPSGRRRLGGGVQFRRAVHRRRGGGEGRGRRHDRTEHR